MKLPNFFLVGAPKCATSAMHAYLGEHPEIFVCTPKEPHFFGSDIVTPVCIKDRDAYLSLFSKATNEKRLGEASVLSLYSKQAAMEIKEFSIEPKILVMIRNPVEMMYAWHSELVYKGHENIQNFELALKAEADRKRGKCIPDNLKFSINVFFYSEIPRYAGQIERFLAIFGKENVHVIVYDDLKDDVTSVYRRTLEFLDVLPTFEPTFAVVNPSKQNRSEAVKRLLTSPPAFARRMVKSVIPSSRLRERLRRKVAHFNKRYVSRTPMDPGLRRRLQSDFTQEVERLSELLNRDLMNWVKE